MHTRIYKFIKNNREKVIFSFLLFIFLELIAHRLENVAVVGIVGLLLQSHIICCIAPAYLLHAFKKHEDCECELNHGE